MSKYIIIDAEAIQKRIEELQKYVGSRRPSADEYAKMHIYREILSQSTPLIPEIEKAFTKGERYGWDSQKSIGNIGEMKEKIKPKSLDNYITNLKLDI